MTKLEQLKTPRGTFKIVAQFDNDRIARENGYGIYFSHEQYDIYTKHKDLYHCTFAVVERR